MNNKIFAVWLTGLPSSGKSSISKVLVSKFHLLNIQVQVLESDSIRELITPKPTFSDSEREIFYYSLAAIGKFLYENNISVIFDATANNRRYRDIARKMIPNFFEIYIKCPISICMKRDSKELFQKTKMGRINSLPIKVIHPRNVKCYDEDNKLVDKLFPNHSFYEIPLNPDLVVSTATKSADNAADKIFQFLIK